MNTSYFFEIKNRFLIIITAWISTLIFSYSYKEILLFLVIKVNNFDTTAITPLYFIFTNITEIFSIYIKLVNFVANQILVIYFLYHLLFFLAPGLYFFEYKYLFKVFAFGIIFWLFSIYILNKLFLPTCWSFFLSFQNLNSNFHFEAKLYDYLNFYLTLYYMCNINCQIFMILIFFLSSLNGNLNQIKQVRKIFYLFFICFATIATPPDIISQVILIISMLCIFESLVFGLILKTRLN
jgi:sec-independent protein translocase protein TatC